MKRIDEITGEIIFAPFCRSGGFNYDTNAVSEETGLACLDPSKTQQNEAHDADINNIVARFLKTGVMPTSNRMPSFEDFGEPVDYQTALNAVMAAEEAFMSLDARVRDRFENDPAQFLAFCDDERNMDEARRLGILASQDSFFGVPSGVSAAPAAVPLQQGA